LQHQLSDASPVVVARDPDAMLVRATLDGVPKAFGLLVDRYAGQLFNAAYRITQTREDAADATQSAFVKAYEKLSSFDFNHRFFSWIYRITLNEALDIAARRRRQSPLEAAPEPAGGDVEGEFAEAERSRAVHAALGELPPDARALIVMKHFQGLSYGEISGIVGVPEKTVKSRLFTARQRLRRALEGRGWLR
jgi:RNA polymerase sigma-70 factor (ECF subfamily)